MNGAGKSTLMRLITGQLQPTTGEIKVFGMNPFANSEVFKRLGYCPEIDNFYEHYSGREFVKFLGRLGGLSASESKKRTEEVLAEVGMTDRAHRKIAGYSKGMRQRIKLAQAMICDPDIILLDEPLNGLDPVGRRDLMDILGRLANQGKTIIVSSHILFEVEQMTRSILLMHRGRMMASGNLREIRGLIDKHPHKIRVVTPTPRRLAQSLSELPNVVSMRFEPGDRALALQVREPDEFYTALKNIALDHEIDIVSLASPDNNLEAVFNYLVQS
jgi:ABC-2 type transport system ATP-binding protein